MILPLEVEDYHLRTWLRRLYQDPQQHEQQHQYQPRHQGHQGDRQGDIFTCSESFLYLHPFQSMIIGIIETFLFWKICVFFYKK